MQIADYIARRTGRSLYDLFMAVPPFCELVEQLDGVITIARWDESLGEAPTPEELAAALAAPEPIVVDLATERARMLAATDRRAEDERLRYITDGAGQAQTYARKLDEATALQVDPDPQPAVYPFLAASLGLDGDTLAEVAARVLAVAAAWTPIAAAIERRRLTLKRDIAAAPSLDALAVIDIAAGWPEGAG